MAVALEYAPPSVGLPGGAAGKGAYLLSGTFDGRASLFRAEMGRAGEAPTGFVKVHSFLPPPPPSPSPSQHNSAATEAQPDGILALLISAQRDLVVAGSNSGLVSAWSLGQLSDTPLATGRQAAGAGACSLAWCGNGVQVLVGSEDGVCKRWEFKQRTGGARSQRQPPCWLDCLETAQLAHDAQVMALACSAVTEPPVAFCGLSDGTLLCLGPAG
mmetsp:Transcript_30539/g.98734  ORF Transcript_30539/g.98734 Transcript_30539/m.98734 type:complete len:215 (+) Transcript_30539:35-679(+)